MKRILTVFNYMAKEVARPVGLYYLVIILLYMALMPSLLGTAASSAQGMEGASLVFLFVMGLNLFKSSYLFAQANGVTRRQFYAGSLLVVVALSAALTIVDAILYGALQLFVSKAESLSAMIYPGIGITSRLVWTLSTNLAATAVGWFVTMLFYRSGKMLKLAIVFVPSVILCVGLPVLDSAMGGKLTNALGVFFLAVLGLSGRPDVWIGTLSFMMLAVISALFCFALLRRAPVKDHDR